jgi:DNA primase
VVFCFDGDRAGRAAAWRALENALPEAQDGRTIRFLFLPDGEDPDSLVRKEGQEEFERRIAREAVPLSAYLLDSLSAQTDMKTPDGRARLLHLAAPHFNRLPVGAFREMLRKELGNLAQMEPGKLTMLNQAATDRQSVRPAAGIPARNPGRPSMLSPVEMAMACLLHHPALAMLAGDPQDLVGSWEMDLFRALLVFAQSGPTMNEALILEHWREDPEAWAKLNRIAQANLPMPEQGLDKQFLAYLAQFRGAGSQARLNELIAESGKRTLNGVEKAEMAQLLASSGRKPGTDSVKSD